jgi:hypothetical protein
MARVFRRAGLRVGTQEFPVPGLGTSRNTVGVLQTPATCLRIVMAHADTTSTSSGANDNASGLGVGGGRGGPPPAGRRRGHPLPFIIGFNDGIDQSGCSGTVREVGNNQGFFVFDADAGTNTDAAAPFAVIIIGNINHAPGGEVGMQLEGFTPETGDGGINEFVEVVREDAGGQSDGYTFYTLGQQQGEFHGQSFGFSFTSVISQFPLGCFGVKDHFTRKFRKAGFDIPWCGRTVAGKEVSPVTLGFDEEVFLSEVHQCIPDGGIAVGVVLHGLADDVGNLVETAVVHFTHGMEDAPLHGFQPVFGVRYGAVKNNVRGIFQEPIFVHAGNGLQITFTVFRRALHFLVHVLFRRV